MIEYFLPKIIALDITENNVKKLNKITQLFLVVITTRLDLYLIKPCPFFNSFF